MSKPAYVYLLLKRDGDKWFPVIDSGYYGNSYNLRAFQDKHHAELYVCGDRNYKVKRMRVYPLFGGPNAG